MLIQALLPKATVEAFYKRVVCRRAASGKIQLHAVLISPSIHYLPGELATVVHLDCARRFLAQVLSGIVQLLEAHGCPQGHASGAEHLSEPY